MSDQDRYARKILRQLFDSAIKSVLPAYAIIRNLPEKPRGRCVVVGAGKASAAMAQAVEKAWPDVKLSGVVATRYGHAEQCERVQIIEAGHPVPDEKSELAAKAIIDAVDDLTDDDLVLALISGGGSANLALPVDGLDLVTKQDITRQLLHSGAAIGEMNLVRRHLSKIKGGGLGEAIGSARLVTLIISDVPGDDPLAVASGPTVHDTSSVREALAIIDRYRVQIPEAVRKRLNRQDPRRPQQIEPDITVIASGDMALEDANKTAGQQGLNVVNLGSQIECEALELGRMMAGLAKSVKSTGAPTPTPSLILSGGETTVTHEQTISGKGGRNTEFLLSLAIALSGESKVWALAADTDGIDGSEDAAGAIVTPTTIERAHAAGLDPTSFLAGHDSYSFFEEIGDLLITGPTLTNVNDFRAILITE